MALESLSLKRLPPYIFFSPIFRSHYYYNKIFLKIQNAPAHNGRYSALYTSRSRIYLPYSCKDSTNSLTALSSDTLSSKNQATSFCPFNSNPLAINAIATSSVKIAKSPIVSPIPSVICYISFSSLPESCYSGYPAHLADIHSSSY